MIREFPFVKMSGSGNDFVVVDNREVGIPVGDMPAWAKAVCRRSFGVGADGMIFLEPATQGRTEDYIWHFYNSDGSRAEMCGNGSRCAARRAVELGLAGNVHVLGTDAGPIRAQVLPDNQVKVQLTKPRGLKLNQQRAVGDQILVAHTVTTGVPHLVILTDDLDLLDVAHLGRDLRFHPKFAPAGTNVNFVQIQSESELLLRTYERGVEAETFACGTGAAASALVAHNLKITGPEVRVTTTGKEVLHISLEMENIFLQGKAVTVFSGILYPESLDFSHEPS